MKTLSDETWSKPELPLPFATAGIGMIAAYILPGGLTGGEGFLLGFVGGLVALYFAARSEELLKRNASALDTVHCPNCNTELRVHIHSYQVESVSATAQLIQSEKSK